MAPLILAVYLGRGPMQEGVFSLMQLPTFRIHRAAEGGRRPILTILPIHDRRVVRVLHHAGSDVILAEPGQ